MKKPRKSYVFRTSGGTGTIKDHLYKKHRISLETSVQKRQRVDETAVNAMEAFAGLRASTSALKRAPKTGAKNGLTADLLREAFLRWVVEDSLPLSICSSSSFRALLECANPDANLILPRSSSTIRSDLEQAVLARLPAIKSAFAESLSQIHLVLDNWTSPNRLGFCGIVACFVHPVHDALQLTVGLEEEFRARGGYTGVGKKGLG